MSSKRLAQRIAMVSAVCLLAAGPAFAQPPEATAYWISFPTGSTALHQNDKETIRGVASYMKLHPDLTAIIEGKADAAGSQEYNERLSEKRAEAVLEALVHEEGIPVTRTRLYWTGERLPNVPTEAEQAELQNRVVVVTLR